MRHLWKKGVIDKPYFLSSAQQCGIVVYGGTMLPGCGKKHKNLSAGSPFEVTSWHILSSTIKNLIIG